MKELEARILKDGNAIADGVLKVDQFLTHQVDPDLMMKVGQTFADYFKEAGITKVVTIETSGIAPSFVCGSSIRSADDFCSQIKKLNDERRVID